MKKLSVLIIFIISFYQIKAQELQCNIQVNASQIPGTNKQVFQSMQRDFYEFVNSTNWTNHLYSPEEKIECNILITIKQQISTNSFKASIQVQSRRPVYNSSYNTTLLNYLDENLEFDYVEFEKLEYNENLYSSEISSVLAFYINIILGLDYDSYSALGGTEYFEKASKILNLAQNYNKPGWKAFETKKKNRYWLITNIMDNDYEAIRMAYYKFHRLGLDVMHSKLPEGRNKITECLYDIQKIYRKRPDPIPNMVFYSMFFTSKADELVNIFSDAFPDEKARMMVLLNEIDNQNSSKYEKLKEIR